MIILINKMRKIILIPILIRSLIVDLFKNLTFHFLISCNLFLQKLNFFLSMICTNFFLNILVSICNFIFSFILFYIFSKISLLQFFLNKRLIDLSKFFMIIYRSFLLVNLFLSF